jgi:L-alanine-DL-glutamate epimerase-like enolase superfamily enzyme
MDRLEGLALYRLELPLTKPYRLAFGDVTRYDTILAVATDREGTVGFGEATVLTGYTDETIDDAWRVARDAAPRIATEARPARDATLARLAATHPFTATAFGTALDMLDPTFRADAVAADVPLVGLLDAKGEDAIAAQTDALLAAGYRTIKIKVGFDVEADARFVRDVQRANRGRARIRVDANQGYSAQQGVDFVRRIEPEAIELFEQPCAAGDWDSHLEVARAASVPLMLDESIYGMADIEKAARLDCAEFIKLKLMKLVTIDALAAGITRIRELGMQPVLGNGVAGDPGCWLEARVAARLIDNAGEMNGHLKAVAALLDPPLGFERGSIRLAPGYAPRLDMETVQRFCVDSLKCAGAGVRAA